MEELSGKTGMPPEEIIQSLEANTDDSLHRPVSGNEGKELTLGEQIRDQKNLIEQQVDHIFLGAASGYVGVGRTPVDPASLCRRKDTVRGGKTAWHDTGSDFQTGKETACEITKYGIKCDTVLLIDKKVQ